jgi:hypothetical protein
MNKFCRLFMDYFYDADFWNYIKTYFHLIRRNKNDNS